MPDHIRALAACFRRHLWLIPMSLAVIVVAIVLPVAFTGGPSYPHSWCGETLTTMYDSSHSTFSDFMNHLRLARNDGAPTDNLISDENALSQDYASSGSASVSDISTYLAAESSDMTSIGNDARAINRACGKPAGYKINRLAIPSSD